MRSLALLVTLIAMVLASSLPCAADSVPLQGKVTRTRPDGSAEVRLEGEQPPRLRDVFIIYREGTGLGECRLTSMSRSETVVTPHPWCQEKMRPGDTLVFLRHADHADSAADGWHLFTPPDGAFTVMAPPLFRHVVHRGSGNEGIEGMEYVFGDARERQTFHLNYTDLPHVVTDVEGTLDTGAERVTAPSDQVLGKHAIRRGGVPGREIEIIRKEVRFRIHLYLSGNRMFILLIPTRGKSLSPSSYRFLDSLRLPPPRGQTRV